uniref:Uncharacterized protein n=1 Tax=Micrurus lemniscatus lemniscatus TaxID=129467 RepID=A0A2D4I629_MICLE
MTKKQDFIIHPIEATLRKLLIDDGTSHFPDMGQAKLPRGVLQQEHRLPAEADLKVEGDAAAPAASGLRRTGRPDDRRSTHRQLPAAREMWRKEREREKRGLVRVCQDKCRR